MLRSIRRACTIRTGLLALSFALVPGTAAASCLRSIDFGQLAPACGGGLDYCYVVSPGVNSPQSIVGSFWSLTTGDPALLAGDDNGSWDDEQWLLAYGPGSYLVGSWSASSEIDGCIEGRLPPGKSSEVMVVALSDQDASGWSGYFAAAAVERQPAVSPQFDYARGLAADIALVELARPEVISSRRVPPNSVEIEVAGPTLGDVQPGFFADGSAALQEVISGYRLYRQQRPAFEPPPSDRLRGAGWEPTTAVVPLGEHAFVTIDCTAGSTWLATALVFDGGFETGHVSANSTTIQCGWCLTDLDGDGFYSDVECPPEDCDDGDPATHPGAAETNDGRDNQCPGERGYGVVDEISGETGFHDPTDDAEYSWPAQDNATSYEVARSALPDLSADCVRFTTSATFWRDTDDPVPGAGFHYVVRAVAPNLGSWGQDGSAAERIDVCP